MIMITQWTPFSELDDAQYSLIGCSDDNSADTLIVAEYLPLATFANHKECVIKAKLPGVKKKDVRIYLERSRLQISAEREQAKKIEGREHRRIERADGCFIPPDNTIWGRVKAKFKNGVLLVHLRKSKRTNFRHKAVKIN